MTAAFLIVVTTALFIGANTLSARFGETRSVGAFVGMATLSVLGFSAFAPLAARYGLSRVSVIVDILIPLGTIAVGVAFLRERLSPVQIIGLVLGILAICLIASGNEPDANEPVAAASGHP